MQNKLFNKIEQSTELERLTMNETTIIYAHPYEESFNNAILTKVEEILQNKNEPFTRQGIRSSSQALSRTIKKDKAFSVSFSYLVARYASYSKRLFGQGNVASVFVSGY